MNASLLAPSPTDTQAPRARELFRQALDFLHRQTDRMFGVLMALQWLAGVAVALWLSPRAWEGMESTVHLHVWSALLLGGLITVLPVALVLLQPGRTLTRHVVAVGQMMMSALLIHLTGGRIETHFHVFGSLAFLAFYRDWRVLMSASAVVAVDHFLRGMYWPESVFGVEVTQPWRWLEHAGWVVFEDVFLFVSIRISLREMAATAARQARLEEVNTSIERTVALRTAELTKEVANRTRSEQALILAKEAAEAANRSKSTFLATMSHEIRTPMNGVLGMAELLSHTELDANQHEQLAMIRNSGESLLVVINDILDFSKIEAGRMELEQLGFSLHELFGQTLQALGQQASAKGLELELEVPADLPDLRRGDPARLRQVLTNLVSNAIKFTRKGWVRVTVSPGQGPRQVRVEVVDTGAGIAPELQAKLFKPFSQLDASTTRKHGGTGLGLAISARIVELMGGRVGVESQPGRGSTFWFEVPLPPAAVCEVHGEGDRMPETLGELAGKTVLLVDDNAVNRMVAGAQMRRWGMVVHEAADAVEALEKLRATAHDGGGGFDAAVLDGTMPDMDGWQLAEIIRQLPGYGTLPLVMVSSLGLDGGHDRPEARLFHRVLQKPVRPTQLAKALAEALTTWRSTGKAAPAPVAGRALRILLVEDSPINQRVARSMLEKGGHRVTLAENGVEALAHLNGPGLFDLVLMDCQMPEMDGFEATRRLRRREAENGWVPCRVVAMTANVMQGDQDACLAAGMDDYLAKPVRMEQLLKMVDGA